MITIERTGGLFLPQALIQDETASGLDDQMGRRPGCRPSAVTAGATAHDPGPFGLDDDLGLRAIGHDPIDRPEDRSGSASPSIRPSEQDLTAADLNRQGVVQGAG